MSAEKKEPPKGRTIESSLPPAVKLKNIGDWCRGLYSGGAERIIQGDAVMVYDFKCTDAEMEPLHGIKLGDHFSVFGKADIKTKMKAIDRLERNPGQQFEIFIQRMETVPLPSGYDMVEYLVRIVED